MPVVSSQLDTFRCGPTCPSVVEYVFGISSIKPCIYDLIHRVVNELFTHLSENIRFFVIERRFHCSGSHTLWNFLCLFSPKLSKLIYVAFLSYDAARAEITNKQSK